MVLLKTEGESNEEFSADPQARRAIIAFRTIRAPAITTGAPHQDAYLETELVSSARFYAQMRAARIE